MQSISSKLKILIPAPGIYRQEVEIKSFLSFAPYYKILNEKILQSNEQFLEFYLTIIQKLEASPELLQPIQDLTIINRHEQLFQLIASTLFPFSGDLNRKKAFPFDLNHQTTKRSVVALIEHGDL